MTAISPEDQQILDALKNAATQSLERKRLLGQCAVVWRDDRPVIIDWKSAETPSQQAALQQAIQDGENSGKADHSLKELLDELNSEKNATGNI
jgi:hypothetical protein